MKSRFWIFILLIFVVGCSDQKILERLGFTRLAAYDSNEGEGIRVTINIPKADQKGRLVLTAVTQTSKEARLVFARQNNREIVSGQLRMVLFGSDLAHKGIWQHMDTLIRDPSISTKTTVVVVEGNASDLISTEYKPYPTTSDYLTKLIEMDSEKGVIPNANLYSFARDYMNDGVDPVASLVRKGERSVTVIGTALFRDDHYVGRVEPPKSVVLTMLQRNLRGADLFLRIDNKEEVMLGNVASHKSIEVKGKSPDRMKAIIKLNVQGSVQEYTGNLDLTKASNQLELEKMMSDALKDNIEDMVKTFQKEKVDPIGLGKLMRNNMESYAEWERIDQRKAVSDIEVEIKAKVHIKDFGRLQE